jgi:hypothetical protein
VEEAVDEEIEEPAPLLPMRSLGAWGAGLQNDGWSLAAFIMSLLGGTMPACLPACNIVVFTVLSAKVCAGPKPGGVVGCQPFFILFFCKEKKIRK